MCIRDRDGTLNKANAAYAFGGPEDAIAMLNRNLDMDIEHYVTVNFDALIDVIDAVGGVEIDVQEEEISYICGYAMEIMDVTGRVSPVSYTHLDVYKRQVVALVLFSPVMAVVAMIIKFTSPGPVSYTHLNKA